MLGDALVAFLSSRRAHDDARIDAWRFELATADRVRIGMRGGELGGPYGAPSAASRLGGSVELRWSDGRTTRATLTRESLGCSPTQMAAWRAEAIEVEHRATVAPPAECPIVQMYDARVAEAVHGSPDRLLDLVSGLGAGLLALGTERPDVAVVAGAGRRRVVTSAGFDLAWEETTFGLDASAEDLYAASFATRRHPSDGEIEQLADDVAETVRLLRRAESPPIGASGVLFDPTVVDALLARFFATNLNGRSIERGASRFSPDDVARQAVVMRPDLYLTIDTTLPFELATSPCSGEGVPGGRVALVAGGRLMTPILNCEQAARMGLAPTPVARGRPSLILASSAPPLDRDAALAQLHDGVLVRGLMGLHTQPARRGDVASVAAGAQVVRGGRLAGRTDVLLRFNVFDLLGSEGTAPVRFPASITPGRLAETGVEVRSA